MEPVVIVRARVPDSSLRVQILVAEVQNSEIRKM